MAWAKNYWPEAVAILVAIALLVLAWTPPARGGEPPFVVTVAAPPVFTVTVVKPAPPRTVRWQWWDAYGNTWFTDEPAPPRPMPMPAPGVAAPRPFAPAPSPATTPAPPADTAPPPAAGTFWYSGSTPTAPTPTGVRSVVTSGLIDGCTSYG